ncbi:winged helix-turn-helix transcriptional regulator [Tsuneonella sp. HG222]
MSKLQSAEQRRNGGSAMQAARPDDGWRTALQAYAAGLWARAATGSKEPDLPTLPALGSMAGEALALVETFALGAVARAQRGGATLPDSPPEDFSSQIGLILNSLEPSAATRRSSPEGDAPIVFQSELWQVLHKMRESAELSYSREAELVELDRRILFLLRQNGPTVPAGLSSAVGVDKAQVSRSVKRLLELRMAERDQIRSPVALTRKGEVVADRLLRLADLRNRELTFDIEDEELDEFFAAMEKLLDRSVALYEQERAKTADPGRDDGEIETTVAERRAGEALPLDRSRIMSPLLTLSAYFSRSGALAFKRRTGLSNFEAWVLNEVGRASPIDWPTLTDALQRDHSQAGRTVRALMDRGLLAREGRPGRRHGRFYPTPEGGRLYDIIQDTSIERSTFLMAPLGEKERERFLATFDKLRRNAEAQLERERAFDELDR